MFFDGRIRMTFLEADFTQVDRFVPTVVGLSEGVGVNGFESTDLSAYGPCLHLTLPPRAREGDGLLAGQGHVILPFVTLSNLTVRLASLSATNVSVTNRVTIPAGQRQAVFDLAVVDDPLLDGTQPVWITARTTKFGVAEATILAEDNETATLTLSLPASATESASGSAIPGVLEINALPASDILVLLSADNPALVPPPSVVIRAGHTSTVFNVTITDDQVLQGPQTVALTAHVANWTDGKATVLVLDDETPTLTFTLPPEVCEGSVTMSQASLLSLGGVATSNVTVLLESSQPNRLRVPSTVTIPAGQRFARFDLTIVDNTVSDSAPVVTLHATAAGFIEGVGSLNLRDDETPAVPLGLLPPNGSLGLPLQLTLSWQSESPLGEVLVNGDFEAGDFGEWQVYSSVDTEDANFYINHGQFNPLGPERPAPPYAGSFCAVGDQGGQSVISIYRSFTVPGCEGRVFLRWADRLRNDADRFTDHQRFWVEVGSLLPGFPVEPVEVYSTQPGQRLLNDWVEREVEITRFRGQPVQVNFSVEATLNYFIVFLDNVSVKAEASLHPIEYDVYLGTTPNLGPSDLIATTTNTFVDAPPLAPETGYYWQVVARKTGQAMSEVASFGTRSEFHFDWSAVASTQFIGQPFAASLQVRDELNRLATNFIGANLTGMNAASGASVLVTPTGVTFTNGVWSGLLTVEESAAEMFLLAQGGPVTGESGHFAVLAPGDISVKLTAPVWVATGENFAYHLKLTNAGPSTANEVLMTNRLPSGLTFISVNASGGDCLHEGDIVSCGVASLPPQSQVAIDIVVRADSAGLFTNECHVTRGEADFFLPNNSAQAVTVVETPALSIGDTFAFEEIPFTGPQFAQFLVRLWPPASSRVVSVSFATSNATAQAGSDFIGTQGALVFAPGETVKPGR